MGWFNRTRFEKNVRDWDSRNMKRVREMSDGHIEVSSFDSYGPDWYNLYRMSKEKILDLLYILNVPERFENKIIDIIKQREDTRSTLEKGRKNNRQRLEKIFD